MARIISADGVAVFSFRETGLVACAAEAAEFAAQEADRYQVDPRRAYYRTGDHGEHMIMFPRRT